jgi:hypothetical protein
VQACINLSAREQLAVVFFMDAYWLDALVWADREHREHTVALAANVRPAYLRPTFDER